MMLLLALGIHTLLLGVASITVPWDTLLLSVLLSTLLPLVPMMLPLLLA